METVTHALLYGRMAMPNIINHVVSHIGGPGGGLLLTPALKRSG